MQYRQLIFDVKIQDDLYNRERMNNFLSVMVKLMALAGVEVLSPTDMIDAADVEEYYVEYDGKGDPIVSRETSTDEPVKQYYKCADAEGTSLLKQGEYYLGHPKDDDKYLHIPSLPFAGFNMYALSRFVPIIEANEYAEEHCHHCDATVALPLPLGVYICTNCGNSIVNCSMCTEDYTSENYSCSEDCKHYAKCRQEEVGEND